MKRVLGIAASVLLASTVGLADKATVDPPAAPDVQASDAEWKNEAFVIGYGKAQKAWVDAVPAFENWQPVEQPDLAEKLKSAPKLKIDKVGPPVRVVANTRGHVLVVPNKDGKTWDALFHYFQSYSGEQEVFIVELGTGEQKTLWFNSERKEGRKEKVSPFGAWYAHGKLFWPSDATHIAWYDPEKNDIFYAVRDPARLGKVAALRTATWPVPGEMRRRRIWRYELTLVEVPLPE